MRINLDELEAVARAAQEDWRSPVPTMPLRRYHEATYPTTVLALIAELRQEREQAAEASHAAGRHKSDAAYWENEYETAEDMKAELRAELRRAHECIETLESKSMRLINANDGEWVEIPAEDWDAALTAYDQEGAS